MQSFTSLNTPETVEFEDLRNPGIVTDVPRAFDAEFTETVGEFDVYREIDIVEIIRPEVANLRYQIGLTTQVIGAIPVVDFGTLPSGVTLVSNANTYTISGIDTLAKWNAVKDPEIQINDFLGNFAYSVKIIFFNGTADEEIRWTVGTYVPLSLMPAEFTQSVNATVIKEAVSVQSTQFNLTASASVLKLVDPGVIAMQSTTQQTTNGIQIFVLLSDATAPITYSTNTNFNITSSPLILRPESNFTMLITPSNLGAISNAQLISPDLILGSSTDYNNPRQGQSNLGFWPRQVAAEETFVATANFDYGLNSKGVMHVFNNDGSLRFTLDTPFNVNDSRFGVTLSTSTNYIATVVNRTSPGPGSAAQFRVYDAVTGGLERSIDTIDWTLPDTVVNTPPDFNISNNHIALVAPLKSSPGATVTFRLYNIATGNLQYNVDTSFDTEGISSAVVNSTHFGFVRFNPVGSVSTLRIFNLSGNTLAYTVNVLGGTPVVLDDDYLYVYTSNTNQLQIRNKSTGNLITTLIGSSVQTSSQYILTRDASNISRIYRKDNFVLVHESGTLITDISNNYTWYNILSSTDGKLQRRTITEDSNVSFNATTKVISITGTREEINTTLNNKIRITPVTGFASNYNLNYQAERADEKTSDVKTQNVNRI
jgi:hypothetical protein